ncbi:MAG: hypothetical protein KJ799_07310 [Bacteroidetes bacterium]|nr:hypothetical protein [Bacteroidota bacterium]MBU1680655.1 hypothetical protein [Bacteroidota bacterium]MBU2506516.1 hypothetical protein [Bacteroidota bacterium]
MTRFLLFVLISYLVYVFIKILKSLFVGRNKNQEKVNHAYRDPKKYDIKSKDIIDAEFEEIKDDDKSKTQ